MGLKGHSHAYVDGAIFNADETRVLSWTNRAVRLWDTGGLPRGHLVSVACDTLPDHETGELKGRYRMIVKPICGDETPAPVWAELVGD